MDNSLGDAIRRARQRQGLTQAEVAAEVRGSQAQISSWETGRSSPSDQQLEALKRVVGRIRRSNQSRPIPTPTTRRRRGGSGRAGMVDRPTRPGPTPPVVVSPKAETGGSRAGAWQSGAVRGGGAGTEAGRNDTHGRAGVTTRATSHTAHSWRPAVVETPPGTTPSASNGVVAKALTQQELESRLWAAADSLRGPVDPADFKAYIFPLLFFKWISDTWNMEHAEAVGVYGLEVQDEEEADYHRFVVPDGCHWKDLRATATNVGVKLGLTLDRLQAANPGKLAGIFGDVAWGNKERLPEASLINLISAFDGLQLNPKLVPHDVLGAAYEYLLKQFADASGKKAGEFFTPRAVVRLLVSILDPQPGETIYDPACGSGGMLVEAIGEVREKGGDPRTLRLHGQEVNLTTSAIARMNLYLHDIEDFSILRGDTLRDPLFRTPQGDLQRFDVVIANPPFSLANWGADAWVGDARALAGVPPASCGDFAWVQHMVYSMRANTGRVGVVMPHGVLFRGAVEKEIRQKLIESDLLDAVISLPPNIFYSTPIPACLLIFQAVKLADRRGLVHFIDGSRRFAKGRNQNQLTGPDVEALLTTYRQSIRPDDGSVDFSLVTIDQIAEHDWDLTIPTYVTTATAEPEDVRSALANLRSTQAVARELEDQLMTALRAAGYD